MNRSVWGLLYAVAIEQRGLKGGRLLLVLVASFVTEVALYIFCHEGRLFA